MAETIHKNTGVEIKSVIVYLLATVNSYLATINEFLPLRLMDRLWFLQDFREIYIKNENSPN